MGFFVCLFVCITLSSIFIVFQTFKTEKKKKKENWKTLSGMCLEKIISFGIFNGKKKIKGRLIHDSKKMTQNIKTCKKSSENIRMMEIGLTHLICYKLTHSLVMPGF